MSRLRTNVNKLQRIVADVSEAKSVTTESDALTSAVANWISVESWGGSNQSWQPGRSASARRYFESYPEFELDIDCDAAETLTGTPKLFACRLGPVAIADDTFTASGATLTATTHALLDGDGPVLATSSDTLPAGLVSGTGYYVEYATANTFKLHTTRAGAVAKDADTLVTTTDAGTGTHTLVDVQDALNADDNSQRFRHTLVGNLNEGSDITLGVQTSYVERVKHSPLNLYYFVTATETNTETVTIRVTPAVTFEE